MTELNVSPVLELLFSPICYYGGFLDVVLSCVISPRKRFLRCRYQARNLFCFLPKITALLFVCWQRSIERNSQPLPWPSCLPWWLVAPPSLQNMLGVVATSWKWLNRFSPKYRQRTTNWPTVMAGRTFSITVFHNSQVRMWRNPPLLNPPIYGCLSSKKCCLMLVSNVVCVLLLIIWKSKFEPAHKNYFANKSSFNIPPMLFPLLPNAYWHRAHNTQFSDCALYYSYVRLLHSMRVFLLYRDIFVRPEVVFCLVIPILFEQV